MEVTREMIGAAHDVMLAKGDFILSANLLERIFLAMLAARPQEKVSDGETATEGHNAALRGGEAVPLESTVMQED